jgi:hypothetical protein
MKKGAKQLIIFLSVSFSKLMMHGDDLSFLTLMKNYLIDIVTVLQQIIK